MSFANTNERIEKELNIYFKPTPDSFILTTPKLEKTDHQLEHTIGKYFPQAEFISVIDLLHSVQIKADFLDSFKHYSLQNTPIKNLNQICYMLQLLDMVVISHFQRWQKYLKGSVRINLILPLHGT